MVSAALLGLAASWPVETRRGVDHVVETRTIPLSRKALDFIGRDHETKRLLREIVGDRVGAASAVLTIFDWVRSHVELQGPERPVIDDHVIDIVHRGYGAPDQVTEAFALLASYAGFPAAAVTLETGSGGGGLVLAAVQMEGDLHLFDVVLGVYFADTSGALVGFDRLRSDPELARTSLRGPVPDPDAYIEILRASQAPRPNFRRTEMQKPGARLGIELRRLLSRWRSAVNW
jgi:hypothetical protein